MALTYSGEGGMGEGDGGAGGGGGERERRAGPLRVNGTETAGHGRTCARHQAPTKARPRRLQALVGSAVERGKSAAAPRRGWLPGVPCSCGLPHAGPMGAAGASAHGSGTRGESEHAQAARWWLCLCAEHNSQGTGSDDGRGGE